MAKTWMITGVSSGFGREMTEQLLSAGDRVIGTVRSTAKVADLIKKYPDTFDCVILDVTDAAKVTETVNEAAAKHGRIDVYVSNAGYGLFGAAEELSLEEIDRILNTNLRGSIAFIRAAIPHLRKQGGGRIIQISSYGGQVAYPGNSLYHATKFGIDVTIVEPGGARTEFRYGSARVAKLMPEYDGSATHAFLKMLDPKNGLAPGDPAKMAARIIESADTEKPLLHMVLGSQALKATIATLQKRLAEYETETELAASTDIVE